MLRPMNSNLRSIAFVIRLVEASQRHAASLSIPILAPVAVDGGMFFRRNGLLFLPREDVQKFADKMIAAQPMLGALAADPSPRGVFDALDLFAQGPLHGEAAIDALDRPFRAVARAVDVTLDGGYQPLSW